MNKHTMLMLTLCALQTTHTAKPILEAKPLPVTTQMQMTNSIVAATTTPITVQDTPQPVQISEQHLAGHSKLSSGSIPDITQQTVTTLKTAPPVAMSVAMQPTAPSQDVQVAQQAPVTLTPNTQDRKSVV